MHARTSTTIALVLAAAAVALAKAPAENMTGKKQHAMMNCPSAVAGATTTVVDRKDGVELRVRGKSSAVQAEIRRRAYRQGEVALQTNRGALEHTGTGTGSGKFGFCPGMIEDTRVEVDDTPDGAILTVRAKEPSEVARLQKLTRARADALRSR
jgi:hypothetical protein